MSADHLLFWSVAILAAAALVVASAVACLVLLRWLVVLVPVITLTGFAFEPDLQLRFTATLLGALAILSLPPLALAWIWRQVARPRALCAIKADPPSALESVHQAFAGEMARDSAHRRCRAAVGTQDQEERDKHARALERQGFVSLWRQGGLADGCG